MADPMLAWNDPNVPKSSLQIYLEQGGDPARAAEFLYASSAKGATAVEQTNDFMRDRTPAELQAIRNAEQGWTDHFLGSGIYNPGGANSYAIQNSTNNSYDSAISNFQNRYIQDPTTGKWNFNPNVTSRATSQLTNTGTPLPAPTPESLAVAGAKNQVTANNNGTGTPPPTTSTAVNNAETPYLGTLRDKMRRSDSAAYSGAPQYTQTSSLQNQGTGLGGMYQAQNLNNNNLGLGNPTSSAGPSRGSINFSKALWR